MGIKKATESVWGMLGTVIAVYGIYERLKKLNDIKAEIYTQLPPDLRAKWESAFGKPVQPVVVVKAPPQQAGATANPTMDQVSSGT